MSLQRLMPLSGAVFVVLGLIAVIGVGGDSPDTDDPAAEVAAFYADHTGRQAAASFLLAVAIPFAIFFAAGLAARTREAAGDVPSWRYVLLGGAVLVAGTLLITAATVFAAADAAENDASAEAIQALHIFGADAWVAFNASFGVMLIGAAGCILRAATVVPRWLGWTALVLGVLLFIPFADFIALLLTLVWILVVSVVMFVRAGAGRAAPAGAVAP
jgi:hypothetical protein